MKQIGIVMSTGSAMGDRVLRGVYGSHVPADIEGGMGKFTAAPEFKRISHLFGYLEAGDAPIKPSSVTVLEVEDHMEHTAKAQLMRALSLNWTQLYSSVTPAEPGMLGAMLKSESGMVATGAKNHLLSMGMRAWLVPVACTMSTADFGGTIATERDLVKRLQAGSLDAISLVDHEAPVDLGTEPLIVPASVAARDEAMEPGTNTIANLTGEPATPAAATETLEGEGASGQAPTDTADPAMPAAPAPAWANFSGITAAVTGGLVVVAPSAALAVEAARFALSAKTGERLLLAPEIIIESVQTTSDRQLGRSEWDDGDGQDDDHEYDRDR
jgi:hypothetical protein